ncbi:MAG: alpha/beta fold hydrolase [Bacteroidales bacterium]|nr:alpha/beta fold hydrolase [Bacteroidales bacterium]
MKLFYRKYGSGQPVIILHGIFGISDNWVTLGKKISKRFKVFILDLRNHGRSPHSKIFNYSVMTDDIREFITEHKLDKTIIIGHSMGGKVAMNLALSYPELLEKLIIIDINLRQYTLLKTHTDIIKTMLSVNFENIKFRIEVDEFLSETIDSFWIRQLILKNLYRINKNKFAWRINLEAISNNYKEILKGINSGKKFKKPALFIRGGVSDYITNEDFNLIYKNFPCAEIHTIKSASHWVHVDAPDELYKIFSEFLTH